MPTHPERGWLALLCAGRLLQSMIASAYAGVLPFVMQDWGLSAAQAGSVQSAWHLGYLASLFAAGLLADRLGPHRIFQAGCVLVAPASVAFAMLAAGQTSAMLLHGLAGLCAGTTYTPGLQLVTLHARPAQRGMAMGLFIAAASLGYALALGVMAVMSQQGAWRLGLYVIAACSVAGSGLAQLALWRMGRPAVAAAQAPVQSLWQSLRETLRDKAAMTASGAYAIHCWELMALWAWLPAYLVAAASQGASGQAGTSGVALAALSHLASVLGGLAGGAACDRWGRAPVMMLASVASLSMCFAMGWLWGWPLAVLAAAGALHNLLAIADSSVYSTALAETVAPHRLGMAYSVRSVMGFGAGAISPLVFGTTLDWGQQHFGAGTTLAWAAAWSSIGLGSLLGPCLIWRLARPKHGKK